MGSTAHAEPRVETYETDDLTLFACRVYIKPIPQGRARDGRWGGKYYPKTTVQFRATMARVLKAAWDGRDPIDTPIWLTIKYGKARKGSDASNIQKAVEDSLVDAGVLLDDCQEIAQRTQGWYFPQEKEPFVEVIIEAAP